MAILVFNRYENKYMINQEQYELILQRIEKYVEQDQNAKLNQNTIEQTQNEKTKNKKLSGSIIQQEEKMKSNKNKIEGSKNEKLSKNKIEGSKNEKLSKTIIEESNNKKSNEIILKENKVLRLYTDVATNNIKNATEKIQQYKICNLYYDTIDDYFIRKSISKPKYKEKIRLRGYGENIDQNSTVYFELKKKYFGVVNKRRFKTNLKDAYNFAINPTTDNQIQKEIATVFERDIIIPKVYISYDRTAFFSKTDKNLRISFDTNILTRRSDLYLESGSYGEELLEKGKYLMEIKTIHSIPLWLCKILTDLKIYPISYSKYGKEYTKYIESEMYYLQNKRTEREVN